MKYPLILLIMLFISITGHSQSTSTDSNTDATVPTSPLYLSADRAVSASAQTSAEYAEWGGYRRVHEVSCAALKRQRTIGMVLTCIGAGMLGGGIAMAVTGNNAISRDTYYDPYGLRVPVPAPASDYALRNGGVALSLVGGALLSIGIPNWVVGAERYRRNCGGVYDRRASMQLRPGLNSMRLAMSF